MLRCFYLVLRQKQQFAATRDELSQLQRRQVVSEYNVELSKPDVQQFQLAFDQRNGEGSFAAEVAERGKYHESVNKTVLPISQLVGEIVGRFGGFTAAAPPVPGNGQVPNSQGVVSPQNLPVIPNTGGGGGSSPAQKVITSVADLEQAYKDRVAELNG